MLHEYGCDIVSLEGANSCAHFVEDDTERVGIAAFGSRLSLRSFRRDIMGRARPDAAGDTSTRSHYFGNAEVSKQGLASRVGGWMTFV